MPITKQTIAIIGAGGSMGSAIAKHSAGGNYRLLLFDKHKEGMPSLADEVIERNPGADVISMECARECSWEADIIIMAVPHDEEKEIADKIRKVATQKVVVSVANPSNESSGNRTAEVAASSADELQQWLPYSKVVKAFHTIDVADFRQPEQTDAFITGDDEEALQIVAELIETIGFNPVEIDNRKFKQTS